VLRDVSFSVEPGEAVGIIGINGAGKSTLLKMIAGTTQPTTGSVRITGRVAALLELGMGFHPDFTGRQNALMAGQLLGFAEGEILRLMPHVESFADIGEYIDQPLRVYSSGMQVRLAFAVATAARPDILVVDEALAVGDAGFQRKCFRRIEDFRSEGTTLLFVSHDTEIVKRLCERAAFIHQGAIKSFGKAKLVCDEYERTLFGASAPTKMGEQEGDGALAGLFDPTLSASFIEKQYGDGGATISSVTLVNSLGENINVIPEGEAFSITYDVRFLRPVRGVKFGMMIKTVDGVCIYGTNIPRREHTEFYDYGEVVSVCFELQCNLVPGNYYVNVGVTHEADECAEFLHRKVDCLVFRVRSTNRHAVVGYANLFVSPRSWPMKTTS
jgi:lipopolysaccharide transport system ATP-binding protein